MEFIYLSSIFYMFYDSVVCIDNSIPDANLTAVTISKQYPVVKLIMTGSFSLVVPSMNTNNITFKVTNPATGTSKVNAALSAATLMK